MHPTKLLFFFGFFLGFKVDADPGRDFCKILDKGLKCTRMTSHYFPYDVLQSFNDDLISFTAEMTFLQIENSNITVLHSRSFQRTPRLSEVILSRIQLEEIEQGAFDGLFRLKKVDLSHNSFRYLPVDLFKHTKISWLNLNGNEFLKLPDSGPFLNAPHLTWLGFRRCNITTLSDLVFSEVPSLRRLDLGQNLLKTLPIQVFASLKRLKFLDLSSNLFEEIEPEVFDFVSSPSSKHSISVLLSDNPWICSCKVVKTFQITGNEAASRFVACRKSKIHVSNSGWSFGLAEIMRSCRPS